MASDPAASVSLLEFTRAIVEAEASDLHTTIPGVVIKYDVATQTADVQPIVRAHALDADVPTEEHPILPNVPVRFPGGGGFIVHFPLAPGDHVDLHFMQADPSAWRSTGQMSDPVDTRRHDMSFAYATPGCRPDTAPITDASASALTIGRDGHAQMITVDSSFVTLGAGATEAAALASKVVACLDVIMTLLQTTPSTGIPAAAVAMLTNVAWTAPRAAIAATLVKVK